MIDDPQEIQLVWWFEHFLENLLMVIEHHQGLWVILCVAEDDLFVILWSLGLH